MTQFNSLATLGGRQRGPEPMDARGRHLFQIVDMLGAAKLDLKERRVMIDVESLKLPEDDGSVFGGELLVLAIVIQSARQDRVLLSFAASCSSVRMQDSKCICWVSLVR
ncbi:hypothetical protein GL283_19500 [Paracoccus sp. DK398]|nr:hypothetical protein [Paracoccus shanxieyensis]